MLSKDFCDGQILYAGCDLAVMCYRNVLPARPSFAWQYLKISISTPIYSLAHLILCNERICNPFAFDPIISYQISYVASGEWRKSR